MTSQWIGPGKLLRQEWWFLTGVAALTFLVYANAFPKEFTNWDDPKYITENPQIFSISLKNLERMVTEPVVANYVPITSLSYAVDYQLWGLSASAFHLHNVMLHVACTLALFLLLRRMECSRGVVMAATFLFAIHPVNVESVAWASERKTLLSTLFFFLSFSFYVDYCQRRLSASYLGSLLLFFLSLLSKVSTVVAPLAFLAYDHVVAGRKVRELGLYDKLPFLVLAEGFTFWTMHGADIDGTFHSYHSGGPLLSLIASGSLLVRYISLLVWPVSLSALYVLPEAPAFADMNLWFGFFVVVAGGVWLYFTNRILWFWMSLFVIFLLPVLNFIPLPVAMANRYLYIPGIGLFVAWVVLVEQVYLRLSRLKLVQTALAGVLILWMTFLIHQAWQFAGAWKNSFTLWSDVLKRNSQIDSAHYNLGHWFDQQGLKNRAALEYMLTLSVNPHHALSKAALGVIYHEKGLTSLAMKSLHGALDLVPDLEAAINGLGVLYFEQGNVQRALHCFLRASYLNPGNPDALSNAVVLCLRAGQPSRAVVLAEDMVRGHPKAPEGYFRLGQCQEALGNLSDALRVWRFGTQFSDAGTPLWNRLAERIAYAEGALLQKVEVLPK